jgi:transcriptional regulator with XRE-family HTH domain
MTMRKLSAEFVQALGATVRQRRLRLDLSLERLAAKTGLSTTELTRLESGRHDVKFLQLQAIASALDYSLSELVARAERLMARRQRQNRKRTET